VNRLLLVLVPLVTLVTPALADPLPMPITFHANVGAELTGGGDTFQYGARAHLGFSLIHDHDHYLKPMLTLGGTVGGGGLSVDDPRALDGTVNVSYADYGPELQLGLRFGRGLIRNRVFASLAYLRTDVDQRLRLDSVGNVNAGNGYRATIGVNFARTWGQVLVAKGDSGGSREEREAAEAAILLKIFWIAVPQQIEFGWIESAGSSRVGVTLSWGL
jgi:hypothetical protein